MTLFTNIPKGFVTGIRVPYGPLAGQLASPCLCGYLTDLEEQELFLIQWNQTGQLMFCHPGCVRDPEEEDSDA
jgi:hypothetical protein